MDVKRYFDNDKRRTNCQRGHYKIYTPKDQTMFVIALMDSKTTAILLPLCFLFATIITPIASDQT